MDRTPFGGLDRFLAIMQVLREGLSDSKDRPSPLMAKYAEAGWLDPRLLRLCGEHPVPTR
jgi:3-hydroxyacyl-CoA dehydrogenase